MVRSERVRNFTLGVLAPSIFFVAACTKEAPKRAAIVPRNMIQARVLTLVTTMQPANKTLNTEVVIVDSKVRIADELDRWRLFDLDRNEVVQVDEVTKSYRRFKLDELLAQKRAATRTPSDGLLPPVTLQRSGRTQNIGATQAHEWVMQLGGFRRELWLSDEPLAGKKFWPLFIASEPISGAYPSRTAQLQLQLAGENGFPVLDQTEVQFGNTNMRVERHLAKNEQKAVPQSLIEIPRDFTDVTPTAPAAGRPGVLSFPVGRSTREVESRSSAKSQ